MLTQWNLPTVFEVYRELACLNPSWIEDCERNVRDYKEPFHLMRDIAEFSEYDD